MLSRVSGNFEAFASKLQETLDKIFPLHWLQVQMHVWMFA